MPGIVTKEVWDSVQPKLLKNKKNATNRTRHKYLMQQRLYCGKCGSRLRSTVQIQGEKIYRYYSCPNQKLKECSFMPANGSKVDDLVWDWVISILMNPRLLSDGLDDYQAVMEQEAEPIQQRLRIVNDLLNSNEEQLERLLDLFLTGEFTRELLSDRKNRLESTITSLEQERENLIHYLEQSTFTPKQADSIRKFAVDISNGISSAEKDFKVRKKIVELLNITGTLAEEENEKVIYLRCIFGEDVFGLEATSTYGSIIANQISGIDCEYGTIISQGYNIDSDGSCLDGSINTDIPNTNPLIGHLANNGGPTRTHALLPGSPAIDAIPVAECDAATDQRGVSRPQGSGCDIGAYEEINYSDYIFLPLFLR